MSKQANNQIKERPPVIVVMGHIDHGKSKLLDYIRKSNVVDEEAGGITQHISAYAVTHENEKGEEKQITFLDTPGHEAFQAMRSRGAEVADIAILVVAADDGVKAQTLEALDAIKAAGIPFVVALNKIDKPNANVQNTINSLIENEVYLEGYGGDIPYAEISAKTGENVEDILDLILLVAELEELKAPFDTPAKGVVIESNVDPKKGVSATLIITEGTLKQGMCIQAGASIAPVRMMEDFTGSSIKEAHVSAPIRITGFDMAPLVGTKWKSFLSKKEAKQEAILSKEKEAAPAQKEKEEDERFEIPLIIKTDVAGSGEAIKHEIQKIETERTKLSVLESGIGSISEGDVRRVSGAGDGIVIGFNVAIDPSAKELAKQQGVTLQTFSIIYELAQWLKEETEKRTPTIEVEEMIGRAKIMKTFSQKKERQVVGGKVKEGSISTSADCIIKRENEEIGRGQILGLQQAKTKTREVEEGNEFGAEIKSDIDIAPGDMIEVVRIVEK